MPKPKAKTKGRLKLEAAFVRVVDTSGHFWTVPPGSMLHTELVDEVELGYLVPTVDIELMRHPDEPRFWGVNSVDWTLAATASDQVLETMKRQGAWHSLAQRVRDRRQARFRAALRGAS